MSDMVAIYVGRISSQYSITAFPGRYICKTRNKRRTYYVELDVEDWRHADSLKIHIHEVRNNVPESAFHSAK